MNRENTGLTRTKSLPQVGPQHSVKATRRLSNMNKKVDGARRDATNFVSKTVISKPGISETDLSETVITLDDGSQHRVTSLNRTTTDKVEALSWAKELVLARMWQFKKESSIEGKNLRMSIQLSYNILKLQMHAIVLEPACSDFDDYFAKFQGAASSAFFRADAEGYFEALKGLEEFVSGQAKELSSLPFGSADIAAAEIVESDKISIPADWADEFSSEVDEPNFDDSDSWDSDEFNSEAVHAENFASSSNVVISDVEPVEDDIDALLSELCAMSEREANISLAPVESDELIETTGLSDVQDAEIGAKIAKPETPSERPTWNGFGTELINLGAMNERTSSVPKDVGEALTRSPIFSGGEEMSGRSGERLGFGAAPRTPGLSKKRHRVSSKKKVQPRGAGAGLGAKKPRAEGLAQASIGESGAASEGGAMDTLSAEEYIAQTKSLRDGREKEEREYNFSKAVADFKIIRKTRQVSEDKPLPMKDLIASVASNVKRMREVIGKEGEWLMPKVLLDYLANMAEVFDGSIGLANNKDKVRLKDEKYTFLRESLSLIAEGKTQEFSDLFATQLKKIKLESGPRKGVNRLFHAAISSGRSRGKIPPKGATVGSEPAEGHSLLMPKTRSIRDFIREVEGFKEEISSDGRNMDSLRNTFLSLEEARANLNGEEIDQAKRKGWGETFDIIKRQLNPENIGDDSFGDHLQYWSSVFDEDAKKFAASIE